MNKKNIILLIITLCCYEMINAQSFENFYDTDSLQVPIGGSVLLYVPISVNVPTGTVITNVEAKFDYTAYGVVQNFVSCRFNKDNDPGSNGPILVSQGNLSYGQPGTYGFNSFSNWNGQTGINTNYFFRFSLASSSPYTCTIYKIYVRVSYLIPLTYPNLISPSISNPLTTFPYSFVWSGVSGASGYQIKISDNATFIYPIVNDQSISGNSTTYLANVSLNNSQTYYWQMRTLNSTGIWGTWSPVVSFTVNTLPDLTINTDIAIGNTYILGNSYVVNVTVNRSGGSLENGTYVDAHLFLSTDQSLSINDIRLWRSNNGATSLDFPNSILNSNSTITVPPAITIPSQTISGTYYILAVVDSSNFHPETNESNNLVYRQVNIVASQLPDLSIATNLMLFDSLNIGGNYTKNVIVARTDGNLMNGTYVDAHLFLSNDTQLDQTDIRLWRSNNGVSPDFPNTTLNSIGSKIVTVNFTIPSQISQGYKYILAVVDSSNFYTESNENNNVASLQIYFKNTNLISLNSPTPNQNYTNANISFSWSTQIAPVDSFELEVDNDPLFHSPEVSKKQISLLQHYTSTSFSLGPDWLSEDVYYWRVKLYKPGGNITSNIGQFTYSPPKLGCPNWVPLYRAYNSNIVDHFYCTDDNQLNVALNSGYVKEKSEGYLSSMPFEVVSPDSLVPIYRFWVSKNGNFSKSQCHYYTSNKNDRDNRINLNSGLTNMKYEGIIGYTYKKYRFGLDTLYHVFLNQTTGDFIRNNFYTTSLIEKENAKNNYGYSDTVLYPVLAFVSNTNDYGTIPFLESQTEIGEGINPFTGNFNHYEKSSFDISGAKTALDFGIIYSSSNVSINLTINPLGYGWNHKYNSYIIYDPCATVIYWGDGRIYSYSSTTLQPFKKITYDVLSIVSPMVYQVKTKDQIIYTFEKLNQSENIFYLKSIKDRNNNNTQVNYNINKRITSVTSPEGRSLNFLYDYTYPDLIKNISDPIGRTIEFTYNNSKNLISYKDAKNQITKYNYKIYNTGWESHYLNKIILPENDTITNEYDSLTSKIISQTIMSSNNRLLLNYQNGFINVKDGLGNIFNFYSSPENNLSKIKLPNGDSVRYEYTDVYNPIKPTKIIDANGTQTLMAYNSIGDPIFIQQPINITHQFTYTSMNDIASYKDPNNHTTYYNYSNGNLTSITTPRNTTNINCNPNGTINHIDFPSGLTKSILYNSYGNITKVSDNLGNNENYYYDQVSRLTENKNANQNSIFYNYDNNDLLTYTKDPYNHYTYYKYNKNDRCDSIIDAKNQITRFNYKNDKLEKIINPMTNQSIFKYYRNGLDSIRITPKGEIFKYVYDSSYRLKTITGAVNKSYTYDNNNNVLTVTENGNTILYSYDVLNRITSISYDSKVLSYEYDAASNITKITYPGSNKNVEYTYYNDNLLHTVKDWNNHITEYFYRLDASIDSVRYANNTYSKYKYDGIGRLMSMGNFKSNGDTINHYVYQLDAMGNQISVNQKEPYGISLPTASSITYTYNAANRLINAGTASYQHDDNGNVTVKNENGNTNYIWDPENKLTNVSGQFNASYTYDGLGNRRSSTINGQTKKYILDLNAAMSNILMETDVSGNVLNYYIYGLGLLERIKADGSTTHYYHGDSRGSTIAMTDQSQNISHKYAYDVFGKITQSQELDFNPFRFVGQYGVMYDDSLHYFMRARYYNPNIGRFLSEDPIWDVNLYSYGGNNPIMDVDPNGLLKYNSLTYRMTNWIDKPGVVTSAKIGSVVFSGILILTIPYIIPPTAFMYSAIVYEGASLWVMRNPKVLDIADFFIASAFKVPGLSNIGNGTGSDLSTIAFFLIDNYPKINKTLKKNIRIIKKK